MIRLSALLVAVGALSLAACTPGNPSDADAASMEGMDHSANEMDMSAPPAGDPLEDASIYLLENEWETDGGDAVTLASLRGGPVAIAMVYASCGTACPTIVRDMQIIGTKADLPMRYVLVTIDPERDTPEKLRDFRAMHKLGDDWTMLRGTPDDVQALAAVLGVRYRPDPDGTIAHSNLITLLDGEGTIAARQEGLGTDPAAAVASLKTLL